METAKRQAKKSFLILFSLSLIFLITSICGTASATANSTPTSHRYGAQITTMAGNPPSAQGLTLSNPYWDTVLDAASYSDYLGWWSSPRPHIQGEMLSGEWAAAIYYDGISTEPEAMWLTDYFIFPDWSTNSDFEIFEDPNVWDDPCNPVVGNDTGYSVIRNGQVEVRIDYEMVDLGEQDPNGEGGSPLAFRDVNGMPVFVYSERYVLLQTYTVTNIDQNTITNLEFYQMLCGLWTDYSAYETFGYYDPLANYVPYNSVHKVGNFHYDITQWDSGYNNWIGFSSTVKPDIEPNSFDNGSYGAHSGSGTDWRIEQRTLNGEPNNGSEGPLVFVAGATGWYLGILEPNETVSMTLALMLGAQPIVEPLLELTKVDDVNDGDCVGPGDDVNYTICYSYQGDINWPDINDVNIIDKLPAEVNYVSSDPCGAYDSNLHTVTWEIGTLKLGDANCVTLTVKVGCVVPGITIENECRIKIGNQTLGYAYEDTSVCYPTLTKVDNISGCVVPDANITYNICYAANGYGDTNVVITDDLPAEVNYVSSDPCGAYDSNLHTVTWEIGTLKLGDANCVTLTVKVSRPGADRTITNCCEMSGDCIHDINACEDTNVCYPPPPECIIYVDVNAPDCNSYYKGTSWQCPYTNLQDALRHAQAVLGPCPDVDIWVAAGTYKPDCNSAYPNGSGDRDATFQLINNVAIYGGFPPGGGVWEARDPNLYQTILSGDLNGDDVGFTNNGENSYHVVTGSGTDETAVLDGFTITGGNGDSGGGMYNSGGSPTITNCTFSENTGGGAGYGGGMYNSGGSPTVTNCTFSQNYAYYGGGMSGSSTLTNCTFSGNSASNSGGGYNFGGSPTITNCTFSGNSAGTSGGGMSNFGGSPTVTNCTFSGNSTGSAGYGGGMYNSGGSPTVTNCTFSGNSGWDGGGMSNFGSDATVTNCTFSGNSAYRGGGMYGWGSSTLTNCTFSGNSADNTGGGMYDESSPTVTNCTFSGNSAGTSGGGMYNWGSPTITNSIFWDSWAINDGNEVYNNLGAEPNFTYCDIRGCKDPNGLWDPNIGLDGGGNIDADPCFVEPGDWGNVNNPNIPVEPNDPNAIWVDGNYRLLSDSPCIDAGDNNSVPPDYADLDGDGNTTEPTPFDLDGFERFIDGDCNDSNVVDMGAYEFLRSDINHNGSVNFTDYALFASRWFQRSCGGCWGADLTCDGKVEWADLREFVEWWLAGAVP